jgi:hypothetical protein
MQTRPTDNVLTKDPKAIACCPMSQPASSPTSVSIASPSPFPLTTKSDVLRDPKTNRGILVLLPCANLVCLTSVQVDSIFLGGLPHVQAWYSPPLNVHPLESTVYCLLLSRPLCVLCSFVWLSVPESTCVAIPWCCKLDDFWAPQPLSEKSGRCSTPVYPFKLFFRILRPCRIAGSLLFRR